MVRDSKRMQQFRQQLENLDFESSDEKLNTLNQLGDEQKSLMQLAMDVAYEQGQQDADEDSVEDSKTEPPVTLKDNLIDVWYWEAGRHYHEIEVSVPKHVQEEGPSKVRLFVSNHMERTYVDVTNWGMTETW